MYERNKDAYKCMAVGKTIPLYHYLEYFSIYYYTTTLPIP